VTAPGGGRPLARRRLELFQRTRAALGVGLFLCCTGLARLAGAATITEFPLPTPNSVPFGITAGPDGALWFGVSFGFVGFDEGNLIGRITTAGAITQFNLPRPPPDDSRPQGITAGPDGALWFTELGTAADTGNRIGRITTAGAITEFPLPTPRSSPFHITAGPDGALWFTEFGANRIGRITTAGTLTEFPLPTPNSGPSGITAGPDGALWFSEETGNKIGRITTALGEPPPPPAIPTLTEWGMIVLAGLVAGVMAIALRRTS
jgi:virginiamycin B lyase